MLLAPLLVLFLFYGNKNRLYTVVATVIEDVDCDIFLKVY